MILETVQLWLLLHQNLRNKGALGKNRAQLEEKLQRLQAHEDKLAEEDLSIQPWMTKVLKQDSSAQLQNLTLQK